MAEPAARATVTKSSQDFIRSELWPDLPDHHEMALVRSIELCPGFLGIVVTVASGWISRHFHLQPNIKSWERGETRERERERAGPGE